MDVPNAIEQPVPPSVREILTAYAAKGNDADKDILLAILQAKAAEDQRITALAALNQQYLALQRHALEATTLALHQQAQHIQAQQQQQQQQSSSHGRQSQSRRSTTAPGFPPSPYSNAARSPSPPTPQLRSIVPSSSGSASKRKLKQEPEEEDELEPSAHRRSPPSSSSTSRSSGVTLPLSPSSSNSSSSHSRSLSNGSSSYANRAPPHQAQPQYRRMDINSVLSSGPPISAIRGE